MLLRPGQTIVGRWGNEKIRVLKLLGKGANGEVFLANFLGQEVALKVSIASGDIALEWGILERLHESGSLFPTPIRVDDVNAATPLFVYVMEYIRGERFDRVFAQADDGERMELIERTLRGFSELHATSHAFCDVKPENILVDPTTHTVRFIDVGGVTPFGRMVRQYTPLYDRAFWQIGSRQSESSYDLTALALLVLCTVNPQATTDAFKWSPSVRKRELSRMTSSCHPAPLRRWVTDVLAGSVQDAETALRRLRTLSSAATIRPASPQMTQRAMSPAQQPSRRRKMDWTERLMWASLLTAFSAAFIAWVSAFG